MRRTLALALTLIIASHALSADPPKEITNSIGMKFVLIPAGEFWAANGMYLRTNGHKVRITKPLYLGVTEVTQEQYEKVMGKNPSFFSKTGHGANKVKGVDTSNLPVETVSGDDAVEFCKRLSAKEGQTYRLPTEAEWEYACLAGSTTKYFGDDASPLGESAWFRDNSSGRTHLVGKKRPNAWGVFDMLGNVWEWCSPWYGKGKSPGVSRGGGWGDVAGRCGPSSIWVPPPDRHYIVQGFRVARDFIPAKPNSKPVGGAKSGSR